MVKKCLNLEGTEYWQDFAEICNPETLRYYFAAKLNNKVEDIDLNFEDYVQESIQTLLVNI